MCSTSDSLLVEHKLEHPNIGLVFAHLVRVYDETVRNQDVRRQASRQLVCVLRERVRQLNDEHTNYDERPFSGSKRLLG